MIAGRFLDFCRQAAQRSGRCVLIIDEINRANLARVFGELMYLLEYRNESVTLAAGGEPFSIPSNVLLIGTMNTADRSIALVDHALRRRFAFIPLQPNYQALQAYHTRNSTGFPAAELVSILDDLNKLIDDSDYAVGISFFTRPALADEIEDIWRLEIEPYLEEYFFDSRAKLEDFRWENVAPRLKQASSGDE